jgi:pimeloyl-ACP methyl ester carboxylesterase
MATVKDIEFFSEGERLQGELYLPEDAEPAPGVILIHGLSGIRWDSTFLVANTLSAAGFAVLTFDWRACAEEPRTVDPWRVADDVRHAITFVETRPEVARGHISLLGQSYGGGIALQVAALDDRVRCVVGVNAFSDGTRWLRSIRSEAQWEALLERIRADRRHRVLEGGPGGAIFNQQVLMPDTYEAVGRQEGPTSTDLTLSSIDGILRFKPEHLVHLIAPRAMGLIAGDRGEIIPSTEGKAAYDRAGEPKMLEYISVERHMDLYGGPDKPGPFEQAMEAALAWLREHG